LTTLPLQTIYLLYAIFAQLSGIVPLQLPSPLGVFRLLLYAT